MKLTLKGLYKVSSKGRTYYYAWRGGPRLDGEPGTAAFIASWQKATAPEERGRSNTLDGLIDHFKSSEAYTKLSPRSRKEYDRYLVEIGVQFGDMPLAAIEDKAVRREFKKWRKGMAATPRRADYAWGTLARVLSVAKDDSLITVNHCERGGRIYEVDRSEMIWSDESLAKLKAECTTELWNVIEMALWTGQRQADVLAMRWDQWSGSHIKVRQAKTKRLLNLKAPSALKAMLDGLERRGPTILVTHRLKQPWTSDGLRASFNKARKRAGVEDLHFHDLRGTAVTRLAEAGCTEPEIAAVTGHSLKAVGEILDRYLSRTTALSDAAMDKLDTNASGTETQNNLQN